MKFYGNGVVWNPDNNSPLAKFVDGVLETTDGHVCGKLIALGYKHDKVDEEPPVESPGIVVEPDVKEYHKEVKPNKPVHKPVHKPKE